MDNLRKSFRASLRRKKDKGGHHSSSNSDKDFVRDRTGGKFKKKKSKQKKLVKSQFKIFKKELHLPSPFAKTGSLFWPDFPRFRFFVYQGGANRKDWSK